MPVKRDASPTWRTATKMVHGGSFRSDFEETSEALYLTSGYVYSSAEEAEAAFNESIKRYVYGRYGNPTITAFEERMALLEEAEAAYATATGMAAIYAALMCQLKSGDRVVASNALFSSNHYILTEILPRFQIEAQLVDGRNLGEWEKALEGGAKTILIETPANPTLRLVDVAAVSQLARLAGATVIVDNVFATPLIQAPLKLGADIVCYSTTKHIDGQGRTLGGVVLGKRDFIDKTLRPFMRHSGGYMSPFNAWVLLKGLETMELRVQRANANAARIADFLAAHKNVAAIHYPGLASHPQAGLATRQMASGGAMLSFEITGGRAAAFHFLNALKIILISNNLGDAKSLACHPATTTHYRLSEQDKAIQGVTPGLVRLSVGIEDARDLIQDLDDALSAP